jgi:cytochrome P450
VCTQATKIDDATFAQGEAIVISIIGVHGNPQYWNEPLLFKPRRKEFVEASYSRHAYIPFISGVRVCAGMKLARQEVRCGMRALLKTFSIKASDEPRGLKYGLASRPSINLEPYLVVR